MLQRPLIIVLAVALASGCASRAASPEPAPPRTAPGAPAAAAAPARPAEALALPAGIRWVRDSAEYHAAFHQTYRHAAEHVEREAAKRAKGSWAVVLDADETIISNVQYQIERERQGLGFTSESWNAWVKRREATPLPGAAEFLRRVRALGGRIAIVTNRLGSECEDTAVVFRTHELVYDAMLCRPDGSPSDKNPRFEAVRTGKADGLGAPVEVVAYLGDNIQDFPRLSQTTKGEGAAGYVEFGVRFFLLPNPMYGSWE